MEESKFSGLEKIIKIWFGNCDVNYQFELFEACKKKLNEKIDYYVKKGIGEELSTSAAYSYVIGELLKYSNIR